MARADRLRHHRRPERPGVVWHSLRHKFALICVDDRELPIGIMMAIGGWENKNTVDQRYYKSGEDNINAAGKYFED